MLGMYVWLTEKRGAALYSEPQVPTLSCKQASWQTCKLLHQFLHKAHKLYDTAHQALPSLPHLHAHSLKRSVLEGRTLALKAMMEMRWREGCRLNSTTSPSSR
jgi:hypothetical protein